MRTILEWEGHARELKVTGCAVNEKKARLQVDQVIDLKVATQIFFQILEHNAQVAREAAQQKVSSETIAAPPESAEPKS